MQQQMNKQAEYKTRSSFLNTVLVIMIRTRDGFGGEYALTESKNESNVKNEHKHRILVVDDSVDINLFFKMTLEQEGFSVDTFSNPLKVIEAFKPDYYDLVLVDIKMPHMNGFELYNLLKGIDKSIKVCFITGFEPYYQSLVEQFNLDVNCFIRKPIKKDELIKHIIDQLVTSD